MDYIKPDNIGLSLSAVGMGGVNLGSGLSPTLSHTLLDRYADLGGNLIDTAHIYGCSRPEEFSPSESVIGKWLAARGDRDSFILCTKGGHPAIDLRTGALGPARLSPAELDADLAISLRTLQTDYIDVYFLHRDDPALPVSSILDWCEEQVRAGKVRYYGCSNWTPDRMRAAQAYAAQMGYQGFSSDQQAACLAVFKPELLTPVGMTVLDPAAEKFHKASQLPLMSSQSLCGGWFHKTAAGIETSASADRTYDSPENRRIADHLKQLAGDGIPVSSVLYHFIQSWDFPTMALMGFSGAAQLEKLCREIETPVPEEVLRELHILHGSGLTASVPA